ncbi:trypsin-like serine peptidase [Spirosoma koreense]
MPQPFPQLTPKRWFGYIISILGILGVTYLLLHLLLPPGRSKTKLTTSDVTIISSLIYDEVVPAKPQSTTTVNDKPAAPKNVAAAAKKLTATTPVPSTTATAIPDSQKPLTDYQRQRVMAYIANTYNLLDTDTLQVIRWIGMFRLPADLIRSLSDYVFPVRSYFWLYNGGLYAEVLFWTWFGLIASLLYSVSEALRTGDSVFDKNEVWVHIAKFFYAPLCSLVIFLGLSLAVSDKSVIERIDYSPNQILVAFIMGFFSGRLVQFLQGIKNLIFPDDSTNLSTTSGGLMGTAGLPTLPGNPTSRDIQTAIEQLGAGWRLMYPNVTGIALQTKQSQGQPTGQLSALFEVTRKVPDLTVGQIPALIPFVTPDGRSVMIPTDVAEVGITQFAYNPGPTLQLNVPTAPGGSIRRANQTIWGTLGLRLKDANFQYVLSCYHVLCADLLAAGQRSFHSAAGLPAAVPGVGGSPAIIGDVVEGAFNSSEDFALVRLTDPATVASFPTGTDSAFSDILNQPGETYIGRTVFMIGARSNHQEARVVAPYQEGEYQVPGIPTQTMKGLIKTERLADEGDSGAAVFLEEDDQKRVIGILIGFNKDYSYVLPVGNFCFAHHLTVA